MDAPIAGSAAPATPATPAAEGATPPAEGAQGAPAGQKPPEGGQKPAEGAAAAVKRKLKAVIDGQETEVDEEAAIRAYQKEKASDKRFQEAASLKKRAESFLNQLKRATTDPRVMAEVIKQIDPQQGDFRKIAEKYLYDLIQEEQLSPEQKELKQAKEALSKFEKEKQEAAERQQTQEAAELQAKFTKDYQTDIIGALDSSGLPKTEYTIARMARYMHMGLVRGVELKAKDVVDFVWKDYQRDLSAMRSLPTEKMLEMIGPELADKIREFDLAKLRAGDGSGNSPDTKNPPTPPANRIKKEALTVDEFRRRTAERAAQ